MKSTAKIGFMMKQQSKRICEDEHAADDHEFQSVPARTAMGRMVPVVNVPANQYENLPAATLAMTD
jgi:hypothetical protein